MRGWILILVACGQCAGPGEPGDLAAQGSVQICLSSDRDQPDAPPDCANHHRSWSFVGTVVEDFATDEGAFVIGHCGSGARTVKLLDDEGATWWFGMTALDAAGADITPSAPLAVGDEVRGELSVGWGGVEEQSAGWVRGPDGVVMAGDTLAWWSGLETAPGALEVSLVDAGGRRAGVDGCPVKPGALRFTGDTELELETGGSGVVQVDGADLPVRVLAAWSAVDPDSLSCGWSVDRSVWVGGR